MSNSFMDRLALNAACGVKQQEKNNNWLGVSLEILQMV